ncbi:class II glutamine amidotransferase [Marinobacterium sp. MBR-111]|uniref:class II glutamine amidotransferase n=1 Tax=Marinobacterium sp. MBR-111 TaxID=3156463 RepID=UPI003390ED41
MNRSRFCQSRRNRTKKIVGSKRFWVHRLEPIGEVYIKDCEMSVDFGAVITPNYVVTVIATKPLTDNGHWHRLQAGELVVFRDGEVVCQLPEAR